MDFIELEENKQIKPKINNGIQAGCFLEIDDNIKNVPQNMARSGLNDFNNIFKFIELDTEDVRIIQGKYQDGYIKCDNCGMLNPKSNQFCSFCQLEIISFRNLDLDEKQIKVVLKFKKSQKYKFCQVCGNANDEKQPFCTQCASKLE